MPRSQAKKIPWSRSELRKTGSVRTYRGGELDMIAFPIGGIGAGCVSLGGWGQLRDWEIYGRPGKGNLNDMAFFTIHARPRGGTAVTKVLQGPAGGPRMGPPTQKQFAAGASGLWGRSHGAGLPHFRSCDFTAHYPFAIVRLSDPTMPVTASLTAWNPFIPLNDLDSSIPCAIFQWEITNRTGRAVDAVIFANLTNAIGFPEMGLGVNAFRDTGKARGIEFTTRKHAVDSPAYGTMALATSHAKVTHLAHWRRGGGWFDPLTDFWGQASAGILDESVQAEVSKDTAGEPGTLGLRFALKPGESKTVPFVIAWHFPIQEKYWERRAAEAGPEEQRQSWKKYYATQWTDAWSVAEYTLANLRRLEKETRLYDETLRSTSLPGQVIEAVASTSSILKSPTCLRLTGGELWAWEGCHDAAGCCDGTCTHVWNYQQMLPYLFPGLERGVRETDYAHNLHPDGNMSFRMPLPLGVRGNPSIQGAADGQLGGILKVYREWRISGDDAWLARIWPSARRALEYAWVQWDWDRDGVMEGIQHNTYDIEFWGPNTMCGSFYLAALRAGELISARLGDTQSEARYRELRECGSSWTDGHLWNGQYYEQRINLEAEAHNLLAQPVPTNRSGKDDSGMPKYQYGTGCLSDQLLGQLFAEMLELGDLLSSDHIDRTMASVFRSNWRDGFFDHENPQRIYAQDEERGLLLCTWPRGGKPAFPFPYSDEAWTGIEYSTAALMAYRGLVDEALTVVKAARDRYDGRHRNPFDEFECGHHYARAMASYAVLLALSGFAADLPNNRLAFHPRIWQARFRCFFSVGSGWGAYEQAAGPKGKARYSVEVRYGAVKLARLSVPRLGKANRVHASIGGKTVAARLAETEGGMEVVLSRAVTVKPGAAIEIAVS